MSAWSRPVMLLLSGLLLLTVAIAVLNTLIPLWLSHENYATWQVGLISSAFFAGNLFGTLIAGRAIKHWGFNTSYYLAAILLALATLALLSCSSFLGWSWWRFLAGIGCAWIWVVVESALLCAGTLKTRGQLLAAYMMVYYLATVIGQLVVSKIPADAMHMIPALLGIMLLALAPVLFVKLHVGVSEEAAILEQTTSQEQMMIREPEPETRLFNLLMRREYRLGLNGCIISGIVLGSLYGLLPLYLSHQMMADSEVGYWMAFLISAGIIAQWPISRLANRYGKLLVLSVQLFMVMLGSIAMMVSLPFIPSLFILGTASFTLYPMAMTWACERVPHRELITMSQALLLSYTVGTLVGPAVISIVMDIWSDNLLFGMLFVVSFIYLMILLRKAKQQSTPLAHA